MKKGQADGGGRPVVFLDRDGVINRMVYNSEFGLVDSPQNPDEFELLPGAGEAIRLLNERGLPAIVVSNQPGIAKGKFSPSILKAIDTKMQAELGQASAHLDGVYYCLHHPDAIIDEYRVECDCRKPRPGLLLKASKDFQVDPKRSYMIGDGLTDIQAGRAVGCRTILIGRLKCDVCELMDDLDARPELICSNLLEAVQLIEQLEVGNADIYRFSQYIGDRKMAELRYR